MLRDDPRPFNRIARNCTGLTARGPGGTIRPMQRAFWFLFLLSGALAADPPEPPLGISLDGGEVRVRVWAPNAQSVDLVGDFNGWKAMGSERLAREGGSGVWATTLKRSLPKGAYRFRINQYFERRDPCGRAVAPDERATLFYAPAAFDWTGDKAPAHPLDDLVIYELHVGTYNDPNVNDGRPATFADAMKRLDHLGELGINGVQLLPVHEFNGQHSWGYNPSDPFAVEQAYGGPDAFKAFVKECHRRGIAVHLDIVHNHYGPENLDLLRFDGPGAREYGGIYFYDLPELHMTPWGPRVRFDAPMVRRYVRDNAMMWLEEYRLDGFRWDSTVNIRAYRDGQQPIPAGSQMLDDIKREIRERFPHAHSIAEDSLNIGTFHASWDYEFHHAVMPELKASDADRRVEAIGAALSARHPMQRVVYVDNHDEAGKLNGQTRIASDLDPANPGSARAQKLAAMGAVLTLTAPGTPLLFMGNEFLESGPFHEDRPLDWGKRRRFAGLVALHRDLIRLRRDLDGAGGALKGMGIDLPVMDEQRKLLVYWRWHDRAPEERMVVAVNLSGQAQANAVIPFPSEGPWIMRVNTDWTRYGGAAREEAAAFTFRGIAPRANVSMPAHSALIFSLAPGGPPQRVRAERIEPVPAPEASAGGFSLYASIALAGTDQDGRPLKHPLTRRGAVWEGEVQFAGVRGGRFKLLANDAEVIYWGGANRVLDRLPFEMTAERLGGDIRIETALDGWFAVRFDEESLALSMAPIAPKSAASAGPGPRRWTDRRGRTMEARLLAANGDTVALQREDGSRVEIRLETLSAADRAYVREAAPALSP